MSEMESRVVSVDDMVDATWSMKDTDTSSLSIASCKAISDSNGHASKTIGSGSATTSDNKSGTIGDSISTDSNFMVEYKPKANGVEFRASDNSGIEIAHGGTTIGGMGSWTPPLNGALGGGATTGSGVSITNGGNTAGRTVNRGGGSPSLDGLPITNVGSTAGRLILNRPMIGEVPYGGTHVPGLTVNGEIIGATMPIGGSTKNNGRHDTNVVHTIITHVNGGEAHGGAYSN